MKKLLFFLAALLSAMMPTEIKAQTTEYVTDVMVIGDYYSSDVNSLANTYKGQGWKLIDYDLNKGCGYSSHYIYLLYKTGTNVAEAITDFYLWTGKPNTTEDSFNYKGRTYTRAAYDGDNDFKSSKGDLNKGAEGKYIFLYYTRSNDNLAPARAITGITADDNPTNAVGSNGTFNACDFNDGTGSNNHIYMHITRTATSDTPAEVSTEAQLRDAITINNVNVRLTADITLSSQITVFNGMNITVDLNDHKLSRSLSSSVSTGHVLQVNSGGQLTLKDSGSEKKGRVTGGWATNGGGVWVQGNFIFEGGIISGNKAKWGGGIFITPEGTVTMTGGTMTENTASKYGGGIYHQGTLNMSGSPVVEANTANNVYLLAGKVVNVMGAFSAGAHVGIAAANSTAAITSGYVANNPSAAANDFLFSDSGLILTLDGGEVKPTAPADNWMDHREKGWYSKYTSDADNGTMEIWIQNEAELALLAYDINHSVVLNKHIVHLDKDLDLSGYEWTPIGNAAHPFKGNFDGHGHTISGIWFRPDNTGDYHGLFGYVEGSVKNDDNKKCDYIKNLVLKNVNVTGGKYVGGVAGFVYQKVNMENIFCQANVTGTEHVGGIVGRAEVRTVFSGGSLNIDSSIRVTIEDCHLTDGTITGTNNTGLLVGSTGEYVNIKRCYYFNPASYTGNVSGTRAYPVTLKDIPANVTVDLTSDGVNYNNLRYAPAGKVSIKVNSTDIINHVSSVKVNGKEIAKSTGSHSFTINSETAPAYEITVETEVRTDIAGDGTQASPFQIMTAEQWNYLAHEIEDGDLAGGKYYELGADIQVATMIGSAGHPFSGYFDGKGHTLTVSYSSAKSPFKADFAAPFRYINGGTVKNLHVAGDIYTSAQFAGGIVGNQSGTVAIENCRSSVAIHCYIEHDGSHGGLVGLNDSNLSIEGCLFDGRLLSEGSTLTIHCGGFIGWRAGTATISRSLFDPAKVTVGNDDGACFARNGANITDCYYTHLLGNGAKQSANGQHVSPITGIEGVTVATYGDPTASYSMSGTTFYNGCFTREGAATIYAAKGNQVQLNLAGSATGYIPSDGTLTGSETPYTLTMGINTCIMPMFEVPATIASADDWMKFCWLVNSGTDSYSGKTVTMTANIGTAENPVTIMAGSNMEHKFKGTFDGGGYTLTFSANIAEEYCAPFRFIEDATIKNLHTAGTITTKKKKAAGIAAQTHKTCAIINCRSSMEIVSDLIFDGTHGGLIGFIDSGTTTIEGCLFHGKLLGPTTVYCGGFVGWTEGNNGASVIIKDCLFIPESNTITAAGCATFARGRDNNTKNIIVTNCYYSETFDREFSTVQGNEIVYYTDKAPANIGTEGTFHNVTLITAYTNGLKFGNDKASYYFMTPETISLADAADNSSILEAKNGYAANVTLTDRTLYKDGKWNTICLPFDVVLEGSPLEGATARPLSEANITGTTLNLTFGEPVTTLTAGTPYIIKWGNTGSTENTALKNPVFSGVTIDATDRSYDNGVSGDSRVRFVGTYKTTMFGNEDKSILLMGGENTLNYPTTGAGIGAQRAYFKIGDGAALTRSLTAFNFNFGDETTSLSEEFLAEPSGKAERRVKSEEFATAEGWYTIDGMKLDGKPMQKGVYINNGRKMVIK